MASRQYSRIYKTIEETDLALHIFEDDRYVDTQNRPAIIFFFGGGWHQGTPEQFFEHCKHFASLGFVTISADYWVKGRQGTSPFEAVTDAKSAIRWLRLRAAKLKINPDLIVAGGGSAGGHLAACAGIIDGFDDETEDLSIPSIPNALILFNPVLDLSALSIKDVFNGREIEISPNHHVKKGLPPTLIFHGAADQIVPIETVRRFKQLMMDSHNACQLIEFEDKPHAFFNYGLYDNVPYHQTIKSTEKFLTFLEYLV